MIDLPVGRNLQDHSALACEFIVKGHNQLLNDPDALKVVTEQYQSTKDGPLSVFGASAAIIFPKISSLHSTSEFERLSQKTKEFLNTEGRPSTEIWMHSGQLFYTGPCPADVSVLVIEGLCQNNVSRGSLKLASTNLRDFPQIDPGYLTHPYDVQIAVETVREILKLAETKAFSSIIESILLGPRSPLNEKLLALSSAIDDTVIEEFVRETLTQGFHSMSTCVMGKSTDESKVVGNDFKLSV
jgi:choline dehydrogenase-like flavoprotein